MHLSMLRALVELAKEPDWTPPAPAGYLSATLGTTAPILIKRLIRLEELGLAERRALSRGPMRAGRYAWRITPEGRRVIEEVKQWLN